MIVDKRERPTGAKIAIIKFVKRRAKVDQCVSGLESLLAANLQNKIIK